MDKGDTQRTNKLCDTCQISKETKLAGSWCLVCDEAFCDQCLKCHKGFKATAMHQIVPIAEVSTHSSSAKFDVDLKCEEHPDESIKVYCVDHSHPCCTMCATLYHRKCDELVPIEKVAIGIRDSDDVAKFRQRMEKDKEGLIKLIKNRQECKQEFERKIQTIEAEVAQTEKNVMNCIANAKEEFQKSLEKKRKGISTELSNEHAILQEYRKEVENLITMFDGTLSFGSEKQCLVLLAKLKIKVSAHEEKIRALKSQLTETSIIYDPRNPMEELEKIDFFGRVKTKEDMQAQAELTEPSTKQIKDNVKFQKGTMKVDLIIQICNDEHCKTTLCAQGLYSPCCAVFGRGFLLALVENSNKFMKYSLDGKWLDELNARDVGYVVSDVDAVTDTKFVTVGRKYENCDYHLLLIDGIEMAILQKLTLQQLYHGICFINNNQFILSTDKTLQWYDLSTQKELKKRSSKGNAYFVALLKNNGYVFGDGSNSVTCCQDGEKKFTYTSEELKRPACIAADHCGNIYIIGNDSENIHQIDQDGRLIRIILSSTLSVSSPWNIGFAKNSNQFFVTCTSGKICIGHME